MLDQIIRGFLWLHIAAGFTGFFVAPVALITRKGGNTHRPAVSAFAVENLTFLPPLVRWLAPTAIGVPLLSMWIGYYKNKFHHGKKPADVAIIRERELLQEAG